jgi:hypothetical protein
MATKVPKDNRPGATVPVKPKVAGGKPLVVSHPKGKGK